ncbi:MAG: ABC transporter permease subunit [Ilumatobacteraceae bacterium]
MSAEAAPPITRTTRPLLRRVRRGLMVVVAIVLAGLTWEIYKWLGPQDGGKVFGWKLLPRAKDRIMPHLGDIWARAGRPLNRASDESVLSVVLKGVWFSLRLVLAGFGIGLVAGVLLAVLMTRFKFAERAVLPYLVVSQTVPLIALAPLLATWSGKVEIGSWEWPPWLTASVLGAFLTFFPIAVGTLKGLQSPSPAALELMNSLASPWRRTLFKLRFPAAVPYIVPALKLGAAGSVIGVVVSEISVGLRGGVGRLVQEFSGNTGDRPLVFIAVFGAMLVGLAMAALIALVDLFITRNRPREIES